MVASGSDSMREQTLGERKQTKNFLCRSLKAFGGLRLAETLSAPFETSIIFKLNRNECHKMPDAPN